MLNKIFSVNHFIEYFKIWLIVISYPVFSFFTGKGNYCTWLALL